MVQIGNVGRLEQELPIGGPRDGGAFDLDIRKVTGGAPVNEIAPSLVVGTAVLTWSVAKGIAMTVSFAC